MDNNKLKFLGNPVLQTDKLILRKLTLDDAEEVFNYASVPEVSKYTTWEPHKTLENSIDFLKWVLGRYDNDEAGEWGIELKKTKKIIGTMGFVHLDQQNSSASIGYVISKEYWGQGLMTEAVKRLLKFAFEEMNLNRIEAVHLNENIASGKVMQKCGMKYEGVIRQKLFARGKFCDVKQYAILKDELML